MNSEDCNTEKANVSVRWHKWRWVLNAVFPCGVMAFIDEMFVHESKVQVCALMETLRNHLDGFIKNFGYDDVCHLHASLTKAAQQGSAAAQQILDECDIFIDPWHLKGHRREICKQMF